MKNKNQENQPALAGHGGECPYFQQLGGKNRTLETENSLVNTDFIIKHNNKENKHVRSVTASCVWCFVS